MSTTVELQSSLETELSFYISARLEFGQTLLSGIKTIDVGLMMLCVVKSHDLFRDRWFESLNKSAFGFTPTASEILQSSEVSCLLFKDLYSHHSRMASRVKSALLEQ